MERNNSPLVYCCRMHWNLLRASISDVFKSSFQIGSQIDPSHSMDSAFVCKKAKNSKYRFSFSFCHRVGVIIDVQKRELDNEKEFFVLEWFSLATLTATIYFYQRRLSLDAKKLIPCHVIN